MKDTLITLKIANREFALRTTDPQGEALLRKAAELVNQRLDAKRMQIGVGEVSELLSMVAFDLAVEILEIQMQEQQLIDNLVKLEQGMSVLVQ